MAAIVGTVQNDTLEGTSGDDIITGLAGFDTLSLATQASADATFSIDPQGRWVVSSAAGQDTLNSIEQVQFSDGVVVLGTTETRVNTTTADNQYLSAVTVLADGGYVVTWSSYGQDGSGYGVYAQRYAADGSAVGVETRINTITADYQYESAVAVLADGGYVVTWSSNGQDGSSYGIYAQRYAADGSAVGAETRVNTTTANTQYDSAVAALADGGYVVTWSSNGQDGSGYGIYAQRYAADGSAVGVETRVNTTTFDSQYSSAVAALADGGYVVTWTSFGQDGSSLGVYAQRYAADGSARGVETRINTTTFDSQSSSAVAALADGGYVVTWSSNGQDGSSSGVYAQRYAADGSAVGAETRINTTTANTQDLSAVAALADGGYVVTWTSFGQDGSSYGIYAQRYAADGSARGVETRINTTTFDSQYSSAVAALADGGYVVTWSSWGQDGSSYGIYAQRFDASGNAERSGAVLHGDGSDNTLHFEGVQAVHLLGLAGNDTLFGSAGADTLDGGAGDDTAVVADPQSELSWVFSQGGMNLSSPQGGNDQLVSIEHVQTSNGVIDVAFSVPTDTRINTTTANTQHDSAVTALADGGYVVTWSSFGQDGNGYGIYAQRYAADGSARGVETRINTTTFDTQDDSVVTALADGGYVVTWSSWGQDGSSYGIYTQRYAADGSAEGAETRVNTTTAYHQYQSALAALADGGYVVTWTSYGQDGSNYGVYAQRYAADGSAVGAETRINTTTANTQDLSAVAALADGGYVVTWSSWGQDGSSYGIYAQRYAADGSAWGVETRINTTTADYQFESAVAALADGGYVVTWSSWGQDGSSYGIYAQRYAADGSAVGAETRVNTTTFDTQYLSAVAALADGGYVVTWSSFGQDGNGYGIYAQRYAADGSAVGAETRVNTTTASTQYSSAVAALADGGYVVTWSSSGQDGSSYGVYAQQFDANGLRAGHPTLTGGSEDNVLRVSAAEGVELNGAAGNDTLAGGSHGDILTGGSGADTFEFSSSGNGIDRIMDWAAEDRIVVADASFTHDPTAGNGTSVGLNEVQVSAANGIIRLFIGTDATPGADVVIELSGTWTADEFWSMGSDHIELASPGLHVVGGGGNDNLVGGIGNDTLDGRDGRDTMAGGLRNDTYIVDNPNDTIIEAPDAGTDLAKSSVSYTLAANVENLTLTGTKAINGTGNALNNVIVGNDAVNDITGGLGADTLTGGLGADRFVYESTAESGPAAWDVIVDFTTGVDRIDLYKIDANLAKGGNQAFTFIGSAAFSADATGQLRFDSATQMLYGSSNADATPELVIQLTGVVVLSAADIVL